MTLRAPHLYQSLRAFCLGAFAAERGADLPFAFEAHPTRGGPALYEYRPLVRGFVEEQAPTLRRLPDTRNALDDLRREPAAALFAHAHSGVGSTADDALFRSILLPLLTAVAERSGGFDWHDDAFDAAYAGIERSLFGSSRAYAAVAPLVGLSSGATVELGADMRVRAAVPGEISGLWPEVRGLLPLEFERDIDRLCVLELARELDPAEADPPDAAAELADAVSALRLATAGAIAAGPVLFERLDWRPIGIRPVLPIAATQPPGEGTRLDAVRGALARDVLARLAAADEDAQLGEALDRYELALFQDEPFRTEQLRQSLTELLGGAEGEWAANVRAAVLLGETPKDRGEILGRLKNPGAAEDLLRRALVEALLHGDRRALVAALDQSLLGLAPRPKPHVAARALAG
jgi:hypothetical protein